MMAQTMMCLKRPVPLETCILELQVTVKSELVVGDKEVGGVKMNEFAQAKLIEVPAGGGNNASTMDGEQSAGDGIGDRRDGDHGKADVGSTDQNCKEQNVAKSSSMKRSNKSFMLHFAKANGSVLLQLQGKKERLKLLIKMTLFKSIGRVMGLCENKQKRKPDKAFHSTVRCKRDGVPAKRILQECEASKIIDDVQLMKKLYNENEKLLLPGMVEEISRDLVRYWLRRYTLFSKFDEGIKLDQQSLFSVTPEAIAKDQAARCGSGIVIDAFAGAGGNAIQFACMNFHVIAIDIDPKKIEYARNNAEVYGVADKIDFIVGDFFQLAPTLKADVVFLSPPWGGPEYIKAEKYDIKTMLRPADGFYLFKLALSVAPSVAFFLPKTVDTDQLAQLSWTSDPPLPYEIEKNYIQDELKAVTVYYGKIVS